MKIYQLIRQLRMEKGMKQQEVADLVFVTVQTINQYERGKREIKADMLVDLLNVLGYDFSIEKQQENVETQGLQWDLSFYYDEYHHDKVCSDFSGAIELNEKDMQELFLLLHQKNYEALGKKLEGYTRHFPQKGDSWNADLWTHFLMYSTQVKDENGITILTTEQGDEMDEYQEGSMLRIGNMMKQDIDQSEKWLNRSVIY